MSEAPTAKYRYTLEITGNSHDEIERELLAQTRGGYLLDSESLTRDEFHVVGGRRTARLEHVNPDMTPERYEAELEAWWLARRNRGARSAAHLIRKRSRGDRFHPRRPETAAAMLAAAEWLDRFVRDLGVDA